MRLAPTTFLVLIAFLLAACASSTEMASTASDAPPQAVQPGAPGQATRAVAPEDLTARAAAFTEADVAFMQGMIGHHAQALDMTELIADRSERQNLRLLGQRISVSQTSEITMMQNWLRARDQEAPESTAHHMVHGSSAPMPGMLSADQMKELEDAAGDEFYRLFLIYMIQHHEGAITMVDDLLAQEGAAQDTDVFRFASGVFEDQTMEITRMQNMLRAAN